MNRVGLYGTLVALVHFAVGLIHGAAHGKLHVGLSGGQILFVLLVINVAPLLAMVLLWTRQRRAGAWLLLFSMGGAFLFGVYYHFVLPGADNVAQVAAGDWRSPFQVTAWLLALLEALGCGVGVWALRELGPSSPPLGRKAE